MTLVWCSVYIKDTLQWKTKPNKITWLLWSIAPMVATFVAIKSWVTWAVLPVFMSWFGPFLVFIASFFNKKSYWELHSFDYICGWLSVISLFIYLITKNPVLSITFAILSDWLAAFPTLVKSWKNPSTESVAPYLTWLFNAITSFFALQIFSFSELAFPIYLVFMDISLILLVSWPKYKKIFNR